MSKKIKRELIIKEDKTPDRNPVVMAEVRRYATCNAAGYHSIDKYSRKTKYKATFE